ncbi:unnamed protein product [Parnassius apollo]|uniref:(apollo) hypothetical protein n=1 Tax=Parnassius apollo TaxID=110799 RepID=A0A8S3W5S9_PARAO|nr:unnamed protein product [Parnassius apollo]
MMWVSGLIFILFCGSTIDCYVAKYECPTNEEYLTCGSACPLNCTNQEPVACTKNYVAGCFCKPDFLRNKNGACVPVEECYDECPPNEEYLTCGSACPLNCTNQEPVACTKNCVAGCFCKPDFLRNKNGACVPVEECFAENYQVCGENEEFNSCGSACPPTCSQPEPEACIQVCREGCFCKPGYYRDESTNKCVKRDQCYQNECPTNEEYLTCGSACPLNCTNQEPVACTKNCVQGCFCKPNFLRNETGACVPVEKCFENYQVCGENEEYKSCGSACPPTCSRPEPEACILVCREGCFCKTGYYRDESTNRCVKRDQCSENRCPENEVYDMCSAGCQPSCNNNANPLCSRICVAGCVCYPGLLRNDDGDCVSVDECYENESYTNFLYNYLNAIYRLLLLSYYA